MTKVISAFLFLFFTLTCMGQSGDRKSSDRLDSVIGQRNQAYANARRSGNPDSLFSSLGSMFTIYLEIGDYAKSFDYAEQLYNISMGSGNTYQISASLINLGKSYSAIDDYTRALSYYRRALSIHQNNDHSGGMRWTLYIAEVFAQVGQFDSAWYYYGNYSRQEGIEPALYLVSTGECLFKQGEFLRSLANFQKAMKDSFTQKDPRTLLDLARVYAILNNPKAAVPYARAGIYHALEFGMDQYIRDGYKTMSDVFGQMGQTDSSNYYFRKYSVARDIVLNAQTRGRMAAFTYEQEINRMNHDNEIREINLQKQVVMKNILLAGILLLLLFAFLLSRYLIMKRRAEIRQRQIVENELKIQKLEAEKSGAKLEQQKTELEIKALRAQMNPHFIFNCLNSINRFILNNEAAKAADYLTKFAKLIRIVLEKSGYSLITLREELDALRLYMDLEALRFETPFRYEINTAEIDIEELLIPSLIIQPFVENAIWHGFQPAQATPGLIQIRLHLENNHLHCSIVDNGMGISHAATKNQGVPDQKKSYGIKFTTERLRLAGHVDPNSVIRVEELNDESAGVKGTGVYLIIPAEYS